MNNIIDQPIGKAVADYIQAKLGFIAQTVVYSGNKTIQEELYGASKPKGLFSCYTVTGNAIEFYVDVYWKGTSDPQILAMDIVNL